jgi:hypothetical protein
MSTLNQLQSLFAHPASTLATWLGKLQPASEESPAAEVVAAFTRSEARNEACLRSYYWMESVTLESGAETRRVSNCLCCYSLRGVISKTPILRVSNRQTLPNELAAHLEKNSGLQEKNEAEAQINRLAALYLQSPIAALGKAVRENRITLRNCSPEKYSLVVTGYLKHGDKVVLDINNVSNTPHSLFVESYLGVSRQPLFIDVQFALLSDGASYPCLTTIGAPHHRLTITRRQSNFFKDPARSFQPVVLARAS